MQPSSLSRRVDKLVCHSRPSVLRPATQLIKHCRQCSGNAWQGLRLLLLRHKVYAIWHAILHATKLHNLLDDQQIGYRQGTWGFTRYTWWLSFPRRTTSQSDLAKTVTAQHAQGLKLYAKANQPTLSDSWQSIVCSDLTNLVAQYKWATASTVDHKLLEIAAVRTYLGLLRLSNMTDH